jgi:MFS family permease
MSVANEKIILSDQGRRTHAKVYRRLMPLLVIIYIVSFLDRTNIGIAKAAMSADIGLSATAFGLGAGLFFLSYALLEVPSNLIMEKIGARIWIARIMITWGIVSACMAFVTGPISFYSMRLLLGAAEAGLYPGMILYITYWFNREERAKATGLFLLGVCLANIIGAPLGGALLNLHGVMGWDGWRWMFVIEGLPAILLAFIVFRVLPNRPADAKWLDKEDVAFIEDTLAEEARESLHVPSAFSLKKALTNKSFLLLVFIYFTHQFSVYGLSYFLPAIIGGYGGLTSFQIGLLTAIPWIAAAIGGVLLPRYANTESRSRHMLTAGFAIMAIGLITGASGGAVVGLIGFCLTASMFFVVQSIIFSWPPNLMSGSMLAGSFGLLNCLGLSGGFLGPFILGAFEDYTGLATSGLWFGVVLLVMGAIVASLIRKAPGRLSAAAAHLKANQGR